MQPEDIDRIRAWLQATDIGLLELRGPGTTLSLRNEAAPAPEVTVAAPSVGVLLHRHPLRADDLVAPGAPVAAGQVLALLQVGPLLLPVAAPANGHFGAWLAPHGTAVGWGTPLAAITPTE
ncbi:MAG: biotin/lipoyl-containing protein [Rubrivivax sp.]